MRSLSSQEGKCVEFAVLKNEMMYWFDCRQITLTMNEFAIEFSAEIDFSALPCVAAKSSAATGRKRFFNQKPFRPCGAPCFINSLTLCHLFTHAAHQFTIFYLQCKSLKSLYRFLIHLSNMVRVNHKPGFANEINPLIKLCPETVLRAVYLDEKRTHQLRISKNRFFILTGTSYTEINNIKN